MDNNQYKELELKLREEISTEILKDIEKFCKDNPRQSFNWVEIWTGLWKILKEKYGAKH